MRVVFLCFTLDMGRTGQYFKGRRTITEPVVKIPDTLPAVPRVTKEIREDVEKLAAETVRKLDKNRYVLRKTTGWLVATLVVTALSAAAFVDSEFMTRAHQIDHLQQQVRKMKGALDEARQDHQRLETHIVELKTRIELMQPESEPKP